ncbi:MAG TPA: glycoside hydrolase family 38 C-terminal domain-containing protein [Pyrinomonadaceae bacterium]
MRITFTLVCLAVAALTLTAPAGRAQGRAPVSAAPGAAEVRPGGEVYGRHFSFAGTPPRQRRGVEGSVVYMVANSHIDTQWNWTVQDTIRQWVPRTFFDNFKLFEKFPDYKFNFEGVIHYMFFKEYHPEAWPTLQSYVAKGRWKLAGSWLDAVDTNVPSSESLMRQALYGRRFFRQEFGHASEDIYLPDCFGFSYALPSVAAHTGFRSFSTQKLTWGGAIPSPFAVGRWRGADGSSLIASLRSGNYVAQVRSNPTSNSYWGGEMTELGGGRRVGFRYFGVGDQGGAPDDISVSKVEEGLTKPNGPVEIRHAAAEQLGKDLTPEEAAALPVYDGELVMKTHGVGCYTSQAAMKKWNRRNEQLGDAAERACLAAEYANGTPYPRERLREAWTRFLYHQFHDDLTGTSIPQAYLFSWNDELLSLNQFATAAADGVGAVAAEMDTRAEGVPLVVYNPLAVPRRDPVEATVRFDGPAPRSVRVFDPATGAEVPSQILSAEPGAVRLLLLADVPSTGFKVYDVRPTDAPSQVKGRLAAGSDRLESARYLVKFDANGDVSGVYDKEAGAELLRGPATIELLDNKFTELWDEKVIDWPAWEIKWETLNRPPAARLSAPSVKVVELGPVRATVEVTRRVKGSTFVQRVSLTEGGDRVDFDTNIDWKTPGMLVKAAFPLRASNPKATYDLGLGTIQRGNSHENLYEVPGQQWADVTDAGGAYGVSILNDGKYGWDKPGDDTLRLTLLHTPAVNKRYVYQGTNDIGRHRFTYSIAGHKSDWRAGRIPSRAARLNQPLEVFQTAAHAGRLGKSFSMLRLSNDVENQVAVRAFKKAEDSEELVLRLQELYGRPARRVEVALAGEIAAVREVNAAEEETPAAGPSKLGGGRLTVDLGAYQPRTFALKMRGAARGSGGAPHSVAVALPFDLDGISTNADRRDGDFDGKGRSLASELLPPTVTIDGIHFKTGDRADGAKNVLVSQGQEITLPEGNYNRLYVLAAAIGGDEEGAFTVTTRDGKTRDTVLGVKDWSGVTGQWDSRLVDDRIAREVFAPPEVLAGGKWSDETVFSQLVMRLTPDNQIEGLTNLRPAFVKRDEVGWVGTHRHAPAGDEPYVFCNLFKYRLDLPQGATTLTLPKNSRIRIVAVSVAKNTNDDTSPARHLY